MGLFRSLFGSLFREPEVVGIAADAIEFALEAAEDTHPNEYMGMLRGTPAKRLGREEDGTIVTDVMVIPGTESNPISATVDSNMVPNDLRTVGSIHSHPNGVLRPSDADLQTFGSGSVHVIMGAPYGRGDWRAFDRNGDPRTLPVLDVDLADAEEFFHFSQEDLDVDVDSDADDDSPGFDGGEW